MLLRYLTMNAAVLVYLSSDKVTVRLRQWPGDWRVRYLSLPRRPLDYRQGGLRRGGQTAGCGAFRTTVAG